MKFIYAMLYAFSNGKPSLLPVYTISKQKRYFGKSFLSIGIIIVCIAALPLAGSAQNANFFTGINLSTTTNYSPSGAPTNKDVLLTTSSGPLTLSGGLTIRSLNVTNGSSYIIGDSTTVAAKNITVGNAATFTNFYSGVLNDLIYLNNNSSLTLEPSVYAGTKALGLVLANNGNFNVQSGSTLTISSVINGGSSTFFNFTKTGGGTLNLLSTGNANIGTITVNAGIASIVNSALPAATVLTLNGGFLQANGVVATGNANNITLAGGAFDNNNNLFTLNGTLSGTDLISTGAGTLVVSAGTTSTYTGNTFIHGGTLKTALTNALPATTIVYLGQSASANLGTLDLDNLNQQIAGLNSVTGTNATGSSNTVLNSGAILRALTIDGSGSYSYGSGSAANSGVISGNMSVTMTGTGTQILGGINTYTGTTTFTNGDLRFALPAGSAQNLAAAAFKGGTLSTLGSAAGAALTFSTITHSVSSTINLDSTVAHTITFTTAGTFTAGQILTIKGWKGLYNGVSSGTAGQIFIGGTLLSTTILARIQFIDGAGFSYEATQLVTGEIVPTNTLVITVTTISGSPFCAGASGIPINFTYIPTSIFTSGSTTFTAQLSSVTGSFVAPVVLQSILSDGSGNQTINITIPGSTVAGNAYRVRVVSSTPAFNGKASNALIINNGGWIGGDASLPNDWNTATNWCSGSVPSAGTNVEIPAGLSFYPNITAASYANNVTIDAGAAVTLSSGGILSIHGTISNSGSFDATSGTIEMSGSAAQSIGGSMFVGSIINNLTDSNTNATTGLSINSGDPVNITGQLNFGYTTAKLTTNNGLALVSNASVTASVGQIAEVSGVAQATISGDVTVQRYYPAHRRWRLITAPVESSGAPTISAAWQEGGQSIAGSLSDPNPGFGTGISGPAGGAFVQSTGYDQSANNSASIAKLTGANAWFSLPTTHVSVTSYQGYMIFVRGDRSFPIYTGTSATPATPATLRTTGVLNTGEVTVPVNTGFTVVGNPYAATINFNNVYSHLATKGAVTSNSFSLWDPNIGSAANIASGTGGWVTLSWNGASYDASPDPSLFDGFDINGDIQSGAAFAVNGTGSGSVEMDESDKVTDGTDNHLYLFRPTDNSTLSQPAVPAAILRTTLYATDTAHVQTYLADGALNEFGSNYSNNIDWSEDVPKLFDLTERFSILKSAQNLSIEKSALPQAGDTVHFSIASLQKAPYQLVIATKNFTRPDIKAFLVDAFDSTSIPILLGDTSVNVNFTVTTVPATYAANRFSIVFTATPPATVAYSNVTATAVQNKSINIQWQVTNQTNTKDYVVERSTDGTHFTVVDTTAATPTDESSYTYNWVDANAVYGTNYYRIYTIGDNFAIQDTSNVASAVLDAGIITPAVAVASLVKVYPNPVTNGTVNVDLANLPTGNYGIKIISEAGDVLLNETIYHVTNGAAIAIPFGQNASKGVYILEIIDPTGNKTKVTFEN